MRAPLRSIRSRSMSRRPGWLYAKIQDVRNGILAWFVLIRFVPVQAGSLDGELFSVFVG